MQSIEVKIKDETFAGQILNEISISFNSERVLLKDLIEARVLEEVNSYNNKQPGMYRGLVQPSDAEATLNGFRIKEKRKIDPEKQVYIALDAFKKNAYFVLVNDKQVDSLEEEVVLTRGSTVSFIKLTPLVGG